MYLVAINLLVKYQLNSSLRHTIVKIDSINRKVIQETNDYGDVLLQDFYEHYTNLSVKSVMILKYFRENLKIKPDFLFKVKIKELLITYLNTK